MVATVGSIEVTLKLLGAEKYASDFGKSAAATEQAANRIGSATGKAGQATEGFKNSLSALTQSGGGLNSIAISALRAESGVAGLTKGFHALGAAIGGIGGAVALKFVSNYADAYTNVQNRIAAVVENQKERADVESELFAIAQRTRSGLESTVQLYQRLNLAAGNLGATQKDIFKVVETTQKAFVVGGSTVQEAASTATQLAQALGSGKLSGDEFRAISENAPVLFRAIAKEFGVGTGELKEMASNGELTAKRVFNAIIKANAEVEEAFARTTPTIAAGLQQIDNALTRYIGQANKAWGASRTLSEGMKYVADNIRTIGDSVAYVVALLATGALTRGLGGVIGSARGALAASKARADEGITQARLAQEAALAERNAASAAHTEAMAKERARRALPVSEQAGPELEKRRQSQLADLEKLNRDAAKLTTERSKLLQQLGSIEQGVSDKSVSATNRLEAAKAKLAATEAKLVDLVRKQGDLDRAAAAAGTGTLRSQQQSYYNSLARVVDARDALTALNAEITQAKANIAQLQAARATAMDTGTLGQQKAITSALFDEQKRLQQLEKDRFATGRELNAALKQNASDESKILNTQSTEREKAAINQQKNLDQISRAEASAASQRENIAQRESQIQAQQINQEQANANKRIQIQQQVAQNELNQRALAEKQTQGKAALAETARQAPVLAQANAALENEKLAVSNERVTATTNALASASANTAVKLTQAATATRLLSGVGQLAAGAFTGLVAQLGGPLPAAIFAAVAAWSAYEIISAHAAQTTKEQGEALDRLTDSLKTAQDQAARGEIPTMFERLKNAADLQEAEKRVEKYKLEVLDLFAAMDKPRATGGGLEEQVLAIGEASETAAKKLGVNIPDMALKFASLDLKSAAGKENAIKFRDALIDLGNADPNFTTAANKIIAIINLLLKGMGVTEQWNKLLAQGASEKSVSARIGVDEPTMTRTEADVQLIEDKRRALITQRFQLEHSADAAIEADYEEFMKRRTAGIAQVNNELTKLRTPKKSLEREQAEVDQQFKFATPEQKAEIARLRFEQGAGAPKKAKKSQEEKDAETLAKKLRELNQEAESSALSALDEKVVKFAQSAKVSTEDINQFIQAVTNKDLEKVPETMQKIKDGLEQIEASKFGRKALEDAFPAEKIAHDLHLLDVAAQRMPDVAANLGKLKLEELAKNASTFSKDVASSIGDFVSSSITDFKKFGDALEQLGKNLEKAILNATLIKPLENTISGLLGQTLGGGANNTGIFGALLGGLFGGGKTAAPLSMGPVYFPTAHSGGLIGGDWFPTKQVSLAAFAGAQRFHSGLSAKEFPAILAYGERVLTARQNARTMATMAGLAGQQGPSTVNFVPRINIINNSSAKITTKTSQGSGGQTLDVLIDEVVAGKLSTPGSASNRASRVFLGSRQQLTSR